MLILKIISEALKLMKGMYAEIRFRAYMRSKFSSCRISYPLIVVNIGSLEIGDNVVISKGCYLHCGGYAWSNYKGRIKIGNNSWLAEDVMMYGAGEIEIGQFSGIGPGTKIFSSRDNYSLEYAYENSIVHDFAPVKIGSRVRIFSNVVINPGITIGEGAIIGAGAVVTKDVPPWTVNYGVPAKVIKHRSVDNKIRVNS